jgi:acetyl-CoA synthetase
VVGEGRCPIVDTWWQTETGGAMISPLPGATDLKPGSATKPFPASTRNSSMPRAGARTARPRAICASRDSWPGQMRTVWGDHERFFQTYFTTYPANISPATAAAATRTAITGSPAASTT